MEGVGRTGGEGPREEGGKEEEEEGRNRRNESGEFERRGAKEEGGRTKQTELIYRDVADPPRPSGPPRTPCSFSFLSFCYVEPAAFPAIRSIRASFSPLRDRVAGGREATDSSDKMQVNSLSLSFLLARVRNEETKLSRSLFLDFFESYFSKAF